MTGCMVRNLVFTLSALVAVLFSAASAEARTPYDGAWSVLIVTEHGTCDRGYRYPLRIVNGRVGYAGDASFDISGRVGKGGSVSVRVSRGSSFATGRGRLSANFGSGTWRGQSSSSACSGTWTAERRG